MSTQLNELLGHVTRRRRALGLLAAAGAVPLTFWGCGGGSDAQAGTGDDSLQGTASGSDSTADTTASSGSCSTIPSETAGPYPGDGTNSNSQGVANALLLSGIVRSDIRSSIDGASATAAGVPLTVTLQLVNAAASCASLAGYAVYLWHCDREGRYSMYSSGVTGENYLRGVQVSDDNGQLSFTTIFPGCYSGRWPHIHFEVFPSLAVATSGSNDVKTSQLALPASACAQVYGVVDGYASSASNYAQITLASDNIFGDDNAALQLPTLTGDASAGFAVTLQVGVSA